MFCVNPIQIAEELACCFIGDVCCFVRRALSARNACIRKSAIQETSCEGGITRPMIMSQPVISAGLARQEQQFQTRKETDQEKASQTITEVHEYRRMHM